MRKKAYFAASISGGRDHAHLYPAIGEEIKKYFHLLTEHFTNQDITPANGTHHDERYVYNLDMNWIREADVLIAELTQPSLGVGYELRYAQELKKPVLGLYYPQKNTKLSSMITGADYFHIRNYRTKEEMQYHVKEFAMRFAA